MDAWNIKQLYGAMQDDLLKCNTQLERTMCITLCTKEIRDFASKLDRKLTPGEQSILDSLQ